MRTSWTATTYANNLPPEWPDARKTSVRQFLQNYNQLRFAPDDEKALQTVERLLEAIKVTANASA